MIFIKRARNSSALLFGALMFSTISHASTSDAAPSGNAKTLSARDATLAAARWSPTELNQIIKADNLHIAPFREDGVTYGTPTWIWCVEVDGSLYVRAYNGQRSSWYQAAIREKAGKIVAAGMTKEVRFESVTGAVNELIDNAYKAKYQGSRYLSHMVSDHSKNATIRIIPLNLKSSG